MTPPLLIDMHLMAAQLGTGQRVIASDCHQSFQRGQMNDHVRPGLYLNKAISLRLPSIRIGETDGHLLRKVLLWKLHIWIYDHHIRDRLH